MTIDITKDHWMFSSYACNLPIPCLLKSLSKFNPSICLSEYHNGSAHGRSEITVNGRTVGWCSLQDSHVLLSANIAASHRIIFLHKIPGVWDDIRPGRVKDISWMTGKNIPMIAGVHDRNQHCVCSCCCHCPPSGPRTVYLQSVLWWWTEEGHQIWLERPLSFKPAYFILQRLWCFVQFIVLDSYKR